MRSPFFSPAFAAGVLSNTVSTRTPPLWSVACGTTPTDAGHLEPVVLQAADHVEVDHRRRLLQREDRVAGVVGRADQAALLGREGDKDQPPAAPLRVGGEAPR